MGWFSGQCCCDSSTCEIGTDDFNRASVGADWSVDSGSWSISSNALYTASTGAQITYQTAHPDSEAYYYVVVDIEFDTDGDKAKVFLGDTIEIEIEYDTGGNQKVSFYDNSTLVSDMSVAYGSNPMTLYVYYGATENIACVVFGTSTSTTNATSLHLDPPSTYDVGLGTGDTNSGGVSFDNFVFEKGYSAANTTCSDLVCRLACNLCSSTTTMDVILLALNFPAGSGTCDCTNLNDTYALAPGAKFQRVAGVNSWTYGNSCYWANTFDVTCSGGTTGTIYLTLQYLSSGATAQFYLELWYNVGGTWEQYTSTTTAAAIDCADNVTSNGFSMAGSPTLCSSFSGSYFEANP